MDVIGHQDVCVQCDAVTGAVPLQSLEIGGRVRVVMKQRRATVAAGNHVIERTGEFEARLTGHEGGTYARIYNKSMLMPDPILHQGL